MLGRSLRLANHLSGIAEEWWIRNAGRQEKRGTFPHSKGRVSCPMREGKVVFPAIAAIDRIIQVVRKVFSKSRS
jgi:hypothetical protein